MSDTNYLRQVLALRRTFQGFIDDNNALDLAGWNKVTERFTLDGVDFHPVTPEQRSILKGLAPKNVRDMNPG